MLTNENWDLPKNVMFKGQKIIDLTKDECEQLTFHLENGTTIAHTIDYGDQLFIENEDILHNENEANKQITAPYSSLPKAERNWWQKLFGLK